MDRGKWTVLYAGVSVLVASGEETPEGWKIWLRTGPGWGRRIAGYAQISGILLPISYHK